MLLNRHKFSKEFYKKCSEYIKEGHSLKETSEQFNIAYGTLKLNLILLGYRTPNRLINKQMNFNETYFDIIDTQEKAYFLGLLYSDGYISNYAYKPCFGIALLLEDSYILEKFKSEL